MVNLIYGLKKLNWKLVFAKSYFKKLFRVKTGSVR